MGQTMPLAARIGVLLLAMLGLLLSIAWCVQSFDYEPLIALATTACAALASLSAGKSSTYEVLFGFGRIAAYTLFGMLPAAVLIVMLDGFVDVSPHFCLAILVFCVVLGFIYGVCRSFQEASISSDRLVEKIALALALKGVPLSVILYWIGEIKSIGELLLFFPVMVFASTVALVLLADLGIFDPEEKSQGVERSA